MIQKLRKTKARFIYSIATVLVLCSGFFVHAQLTSEAIVVSKVHVFPGSISSTEWKNADIIRNHNLSEFALYQEFNAINSATLIPRRTEQAEPVETPATGRPSSEVSPDNTTVSEDTEPPTTPRASAVDASEVDESVQDDTLPSAENSEPVENVDDSAPEADTPSEPLPSPAATGDSTTPEADETETQSGAEQEPQPSPEPEPEPSPKPEPEPEPSPEPEPTVEAGSGEETAWWSIDRALQYQFAPALGNWPLVSETIVTHVTSTMTTTASDTEAVPPLTEADSQPQTNFDETVSNPTEPVVSVPPEEDVEGEPPQEVGQADNPDALPVDSPATDTAGDEPREEVVQEEDNLNEVESEKAAETTADSAGTGLDETSVEVPVGLCEEDCDTYSIMLQDFGLPLFDGQTELAGGQLRFSLGALPRETATGRHTFSAYYSFDGGDSWQLGGEINISDELTNATNGGYHLFALPEPFTSEMLDSLQIELRYTGNQRELEGIYLDSVWLELFTISPPTDAPQSAPSNDPLDNGFTPGILSGDRLDTGDEVITFSFTDDNTDETLIIKSSAKDYAGLTKTTSYVSVTNTSNRADEFHLQAYFPQNIGEVVSIREWNQNQPLEIKVPEYRPYVYHCEGGWEVTDEPVNTSIGDLSRYLSAPVATPEEIAEILSAEKSEEIVEPTPVVPAPEEEPATTLESTSNIDDEPVTVPDMSDEQQLDTATSGDESNVLPNETRETSPEIESQNQEFLPDLETGTTGATSALLYITEPRALLQAAITTPAVNDTATTVSEMTIAEPDLDEETTAQTNYRCQGMQVVRTCDEVTNGTDCRINSVKVQEHDITAYRGGWETLVQADGKVPEPGFFRRAASLFGFGPDKKDVPERFEARVHAPEKINIEPGETKYFKLEIAFPPLSYGEFWIEAIGNREYGLLDPFWQSAWRKRLPITIDNTGNASSTEQQVFLELDSSLTGFWNTVRDDGGDIRFVQESGGNESTWYNTSWSNRQPIIIQASEIDDDLTDFPVFVDLATLGGDFWSTVKSDGGDIRMTEGNGTTEVAFELVDIDTSGDTGELHFLASELSSTTDSTFYIYYGNSSATGYAATSTFGSQAVWSNGFHAVYHFNQDPGGTAPQLLDSTSNGYDATTAGSMNSSDLVAGQVGFGYDFDGANDYAFSTAAGSAVNGTSQYSISFWSEADDIGADIPFYGLNTGNYGGNPDDQNGFRIDPGGASGGGSNVYKFHVRTTSGFIQAETASGLTTTNWTHLGLTWNSGSAPASYQDGSPTGYSFAPTALAGNAITDVLAMGRGNKTQWFNGRIDEFRLHSVSRPAEWLSAEYNNMADPVSFYATSSTETLTAPTFSELDHWVQYFSTTTQEADVWVQVDTLPTNASTTIYLYYDNPDAESTSDEYAPFTYSSPRELYYTINGIQTSPIVVYSLIDDNEVSIDGGAPVTLQSGETTSFTTYSSSSVISANGPLTARTTDDVAENLVPISFASTTLVVPSQRDSERFYVHAPFSTANVDIFNGSAGTPAVSGTVGVGNTSSFITNVTAAAIVESDEPVLLYSNTGPTPTGDSLAVYPPTTRPLYGIFSNFYFFATANGGGDVDILCSSGGSGTQPGVVRGTLYSNLICSVAPNGTGDAVRLVPDISAIAAIQQADGDGRESTMFLPTPEFGTRYIVPQAAEYVSIVCSPRFGTSTIAVRSAAGATIATSTCAAGGDRPGALNLTPGTPYPAGTQIVSTNNVPFYMYYEENGTDDETNTWSAVQAKQFRALELQSTFGAEEENTDAQYTQNNFAWYQNIASSTPSTRYDLGETLAQEGENITGGGAVNSGDELRLRINLSANNGTGTIGSTAFVLQYAEVNSVEQCSLVAESNWVSVPGAGSSSAAFTGFDNAGVGDGITLPTTLLSDSSVVASYEEANLSATLPNQVNDGDVVEFDWVLTAESPTVNSNYCFRMVRSGGQTLFGYDVYPVVETAGPPGVPTLLTPFDNEHASATQPHFEFFANDIAGDDINYQVQVSTDVNFGSTVIDRSSAVNLFDFENLQVPSDFAPFNNAQRIRFNPPSALSNGTTYWWRVRAADPDGSNTFGDWSPAQSFTVNTAVTVTEWFQTTDEQFDTNTLDSAQTSGSDSVELDIAGSNLIGEYGSQEIANGVTTTIAYSNSYTDPVVVASLRYDRSVADGDQVAVRVVNKTATNFEVRTQDFNNDATGSSTLDYVVMEAGEFVIDDGDTGLRVFASSTIVSATTYLGAGDGPVGTGVTGNPGGPIITFPTSFSGGDPIVSAMVTSNNDPGWIVAGVYSGTNVATPPSASEVRLFLTDNRFSDGHTEDEQVDIIAFERGVGTNNGDAFTFTASVPDSIDSTPAPIAIDPPFTSAPGVTIATLLGTLGADGGYAMVDTGNTATSGGVWVSVDEGEDTSENRAHRTETVGLIAFESNSGDIIRAGNGQITTQAIDFDDVKLGNAWGEVRFNSTGDVLVRVQYRTGSGFENIPNSALPGNSAGFSSSPINILSLDTTIYNELRLVAVLSGVNPELFEWTVAWGQRVETPTLGDPFDNQKVATTTPTFDFVTTDPQGDALEYEISISVDPTFETSSSTFNSSSSPGFSSISSHPFPSGDTVNYTVQSALTDTETYWWRVRAKDPNGEDAFSPWSLPDSFTVDTSVLVSTWHQTTQAQFEQGVLEGTIASTSNSVELSNIVGEYGTAELNGSSWLTVTTENLFNDMVVVAKPIYDYDITLENHRFIQVRNKTANSFQVRVLNDALSVVGTTTISFVAMEAGDWSIANTDGTTIRMVAGTAPNVSTFKGSSLGYAGGTEVTFSPAFGSAPAGIVTVSSANNSDWVTASMDNGTGNTGGGTPDNQIGTGNMFVGLEISIDPPGARVAEDIDYLVFEVATGTNNGTRIDMLNSGDVVTGTGEDAVPYNQDFTSAPGVVLAQINGMDGIDGGSVVQDTGGLNDASQGSFIVLEAPTDNGHTDEIISVLAFESATGTILRDTGVGGGLSGTIRSETIDFFDGNGPRFEQFYWSDTTPGSSEVRLQVEYFDGAQWALVPGSDWYDPSWSRRLPITIQASAIDEDLTDFPVYVDLSDLGSVFFSNVQASGADIRITDSASTQEMPYELVAIDVGVGTGELHFKANSIASTTNTTFYIYFNNPGAVAYTATSTYGSENVWNSDYLAVYHLDDTGSTYVDSTSNGFSGVGEGTDPTLTTGRLGGGQDVAGGRIDLGNSINAALITAGQYQVSAWVNLDTSTGDQAIVSQYTAAGDMLFWADTGGSGTGFCHYNGTYMPGSPVDCQDINNQNVGTWQHVIATHDGTNGNVYLDGSPTGNPTASTFGIDAGLRFSVGTAHGDSTARQLDGKIDEVRIMRAKMSDEWIAAEHANQGNTGAFYVVGASQQSTGSTLAGNESGFTSGPINIAGLDVSTFNTLRLLATLTCDNTDCPTLDDWSVEWGEGVELSGTIQAADRSTNVATGTVRVAVNGTLLPGTAPVSNGQWFFSNVTAFADDVITVFVEGATGNERAATVFVYNGAGNMENVPLYESHLTIAGEVENVVTNSALGQYDNGVAGDVAVFFEVDGSNNLTMCAVAGCNDFIFYVAPGMEYRPSSTSAGDASIGNLYNEGTLTLDANTLRVGGDWNNQATTSISASTVIFTATTGSYDIIDHTDSLMFNTVTFGEGSGSATWNLTSNATINGNWNVNHGTVNRILAGDISVSGNVAIGSNGLLSGGGTTTFTGAGTHSWSDASAGQNLGNVVIDGTGKTVTITSNVTANNLSIAAGNTLQGGSGNIVSIGGDWVNEGTFTANTSEVRTIDDVRGRQVAGGQAANWYNSAWNQRLAITIDSTNVDEPLTNYPVYVDLNTLGTEFWSGVKDSGADIRVTTGNGQTEVAHELVSISTTTQSGELHFRGVSIASSTDTTFYVYFDNPNAVAYAPSDTYGSQNVWDDFYLGVYHLVETSTGAANEFRDSTGNQNDGIGRNTLPTPTTGLLGTGQSMSGGHIDLGASTRWNDITTNNAYTLSIWTNLTNSSADYALVSQWGGGTNGILFWADSLGTGDGYCLYGINAYSPTDCENQNDQNAGTWQHVVGRYTGTTRSVWVDGAITGNGEHTTSANQQAVNFSIGSEAGGNNNRAMNGLVDEVRISSIDRSNAWIVAEHTNQSAPTTFYATSSPEDRLVIVEQPASHNITPGGATFYRLHFSDATTSSAFTETEVTVQNNFSIATGTVSLPTTRLSVGGNFANTGGVFMHNNAEVRFTGAGTKTIEQQGDAFLNAFYDVAFTGSGNWSYLDVNATTTNKYSISAGNVTFPSGTLTVGDDFVVSGSGVFNANDGEVVFLIDGEPSNITPRTSSFADVRIRDIGGSSWLDSDFERRLPITISASEVDDDLSNFPVFVDLSLLGSAFFGFVASDGADIRMTEGDGLTQVPVELVSIDAGAETGELYFRATALSSTTDSTFYIYFDNPEAEAVGDATAYGRNNVWSNGYEAVYHLPTTVDSTGNGFTLTASNISNSSSALMGEAADFNGSNSVYTYSNPQALLNGHTQFTLSMWYESDLINTDKGFFMAPVINGGDNGICARYDTAGASGGGDDVIKGCLQTTTGGSQDWESSALVQVTDYQYYVQTWQAGNAQQIYIDGSIDTLTDAPAANSGTTNVGAGTMYIGAGSKDTASGGWDGRIDEVRIASAYRSAEWISAEYTNQSNPATFIATSTIEQSSRRIFTNANVTATGDMVVESGLVDLPTGTYTVGGSFINDGTFNNRAGTVLMNSSSGTAEVAAGISPFSTLTFNGASGDFLVSENATATNAINLTNVNEFTLASGQTLTTLGTFSSAHSAATTTWTGATLRLAGVGTYAINGKTTGADTYGTLSLADGVNVSLWNSSAADAYVTEGDSSIYSQDHDGVDGDLYIFGNYTRNSGTEYWSYATDFDGTDLTGSERRVNVRGASSTVVLIESATLEILGDAATTTTIDAQSAAFTITASSATLVAEHFTVSNLATTGFELLASTTITTLADALFTVTPGRTGITIDGSTIDTNPAAQYFRVDFATTTPGAADNVTLTGVAPSSFAWFRDGVNNLYGEEYDAGDGNPGNIRWDDSNYQINISGTVYSDVGATPLGAPVCDGLTNNIRVVVNGGAYTATTSCDGSGAYNFTNVSYIGDPTIVVYLDTNGGENGAVITKTPTADITDLDIYTNRVMTRHEDVAPLTIADMVLYDESDDADLRFVVATGSPDTLVVRPDTELIVASSTTFAPGGEITLQSSGSGNSYDGTLRIDVGASFVAAGTQVHQIGGSLFVASSSTFTTASSTIEFTATTTGKGITNDGSGTLDFHELSFTGVGGGWNLNDPITVAADMEVATGTVTGTADVTLTNGALTGAGLLSLGGGTTTILTSTTLGGVQGWTFNNLVLGSGATTSTTTRSDTATTTILGQLVISTAHFLEAGASQWDLAGTGTVFVENGTFLQETSTVTYSGDGATVLPTTYYNLVLAGAAGTPTYTFPTTGVLIENNLTIAGTVPTVVDINTNDPVVQVNGDLVISSNGTLQASDITTLTLGGSYSNTGSFAGNGGEVEFVSDTPYTVAAGTSPFFAVLLSGGGMGTFTESATTTNSLTVASTSALTVDSGTVLAIGGEARIESATTTWTGSTLALYGGGSYELNPKSLSIPLDTIEVRDTTQVKTWDTAALTTLVAGTASLYSQDHDGNNGDLYIFGAYNSSVGTDYWSYETDFDGSSLVGTGERPVAVFLSDGASATWTGGGLQVIGTGIASTTIQNQGTGTYSLTIEGTTATEWEHVTVRDVDSAGIQINGTPVVTAMDNLDLLVEINSGSAITVAGSAVTANPGKNFNDILFNAGVGVTNAVNVTLNGGTLSAWRFTGHSGNRDGEDYDADSGDPGEIIWDDSTPTFNVSGRVLQRDGVTRSTICDDGTTNNVFMAVNGSAVQNASTSCSSTDGSYTLTGFNFTSADVLTVYIDGEAEQGVTVTYDSVGSIGNLDIYEDHVIVRHESASPISIAELAVWDSGNDPDIPFTATVGAPDTLTLPANTKLLVWNTDEFAPDGNVTLSGNGSGDSIDGSLEVRANATFRAANTETHRIDGNLLFQSGATLIAASSTFDLTSDTAGRTVDVNEDEFYNLEFTGNGSWSIADSIVTTLNDFTIDAGTVTLPSATTTVGGSFVNNSSFVNNNSNFVFTSSASGEVVTLGGSDAASLYFVAPGSWTVTDTNATSTGSFIVATGTVALPTGTFAVGGDVIVEDTITHNSGSLNLTNAVGTTTLTLSGNDIGSLRITGAATTTVTDASIAVTGDLFMFDGGLIAPTSTLAVGGSFVVADGQFVANSGSVLLNANSLSHIVDVGNNDLHNLVIAGVGGGWTMESATTTNNFSLLNASSFTLLSGSTLYVGGVFQNTVGGSATEWENTEVILDGGAPYSINTASDTGDAYEVLRIGENSAIRMWNSVATTTVVATTSSLYSQDHAGANGALDIYGDFVIGTTTEYWSYARDFDGASLVGVERPVTVTLHNTASTSVITNGTLRINGAANATTTIQHSGTGDYRFVVTGGTIDWSYYAFTDIPFNGIDVSASPVVTSLSNGSFEVSNDGGTALRLAIETVDANPSLQIPNTDFSRVAPANVAVNVRLSATSTNAWRFVNSNGNIAGEDFDVDGVGECGSIRWDDSSCLLTQQTEYIWRNDDGGIGVPDDEWFATDFGYRKQVRIANNDASVYTDIPVNFSVAYDASMRSDFADLRFTTADGVTLANHWLERKTDGTSAEVWALVPSLGANETISLYMYFGSSTAASVSSSTAVFSVVDDFENGLSNYSGDTGKFQANTTRRYGGSNGLVAVTPSDLTDSGLVRFDQTVSQGETIRTRLYVDTAVSSLGVCTLFGVQSPPTNNENYAVCIRQFGTDAFMLSEDAKRTGDYTGVTQLSSTNYEFTTSGWYEVEVDWGTDDSMFARLYHPNGALVATTSATSSTYSSGGYGFMYWNNNGAWDGFHSRPTTETKPSVWIGSSQQAGGATYAAAQSTPTTAFSVGDTARIRIAIENTGLDITNQEFQIEVAPKGVAPSCGAVSGGNYTAVPVATLCGATDPICMTDSTFVTDDDTTTDLLSIGRNPFVAGRFVADPSNQTSPLTVAQNRYTELEYALEITANASEPRYCFRVTNDGTPLDSYVNLPELSLSFDPTVGTVALNGGLNISLVPGTTTPILATTTVTDLNGFADLASATTTFYRSSVTASCTPDNNNCYIATGSACSFTDCAGVSCTLTCTADFQFHTDPTDDDGGEFWYAFVEVSDLNGGMDFETSFGTDVLTIRALTVFNEINYGAISPEEDTGSFNASTTIANLGNESINVEVEGTDMTDGNTSVIPASQQRFATTTFEYGSCSACKTLNQTGVDIAVDLPKPTTTTPPVTDDLYWGIEVPFGIASNPHSGFNTFTAIAD